MKRRVVITGMGTVNPLGNNLNDTWENVKKGVCGIGTITRIDVTNHAVKVAGEVKDFDPSAVIDKKEARRMDRYSQLALVAADEAFRDSGLDMEQEDSSRCGVIFSSGIGGLESTEANMTTGQRRGFDKISPFYIPMTIANMAAGNIAIRFGFKGMCTCVVTACASGNNAIGDSFHYVRDGYADVMLCGGSESCISDLGIGGFTAMQALNVTDNPNRASIPFDKERGGFVMGEGAAAIMIEEYEHAKARGAKIYGELVGYGATCDAYHITAPAPNGEGGAACMTMAIKDAGISPEDVGYINAHGTSTHLNDACETAAIKTAFGDHAKKLMVSSTKSMTGHLLGGSGAVEAVFTTMALHDGFIPATINYQVPDEECDLDIVPNEGRKVQVEYAASNSLGFGGHNACIIIKKWEE
ncbi:MAG: beta-ketoacyl-ACP synthase II [Clostridium sp.]|nr:beta-ketoacyl-ACP synthase II [Clostridium sp.]MCM1399495.1 beta-ketoacyl-ACP synthase II [Clostridium sp.]MCM1460049.1 beta-ketoacyl-ACP synthase II [Bacteroides sp.]